MDWVWTWGGKCFGYIDGEDLWTYDGKHIGKIDDKEIYDCEGMYIGEIMNKNRLITHCGKKSWRRFSFTPYGRRVSYVPMANYLGYAMYAGYEDFPPPESFTGQVIPV